MNDFHVISGGPGSGKTTLLEALARRGHAVMPESGRAIIRAQTAIGGRALHTDEASLFAELMLDREIRNHEEAARLGGPVFFDRGVPDLVGYARLAGLGARPHFLRAAALYRYGGTVCLAPPWRAIYQNDSERGQDWDEAVRTYEAMRDAYRDCGYRTVDLPLADPEARADFVLEAIAG